MKNTFFVFLLIISTHVYSINVGVLAPMPYPASQCYHHSHSLVEQLQDRGHTAHYIYLETKSYKNCGIKHELHLGKYDVVLDYEQPGCLDAYDVLVTITDSLLSPKDKKKAIYVMVEPLMIQPQLATIKDYEQYRDIFVWKHELANNKNIHKSFYSTFKGIHPEFIPFKERKLVCLINAYLTWCLHWKGELYSERRVIAEFYDKHHPQSLTFHGGRGWDDLNIKIHRGHCNDKGLVQRNHKFCYCYENNVCDDYYITEKILDCFQSRCVPIYKGCTKITDFIPQETFIDANQFNSVSEIHDFINNMDEETWLGYIHAIEKFAASDASKFFKKEYLNNAVIQVIEKNL
ncbi:MAG: hypothetical protein SP4CHLAM5_06990 [Chlamydiia bacterium]|nr:hypothetical protein [Chlamydiia bacterium]MCH9618566.1 hypothetical protein [Chlamydiia bacterium]MCH9623895.1 hypothetical protein [Chlamydiia bacterium]